MASRKRFQCFDAIVDNYPQKPSFPVENHFGTPQRSSHSSTRLEPLEDHGCYLCSDHTQDKPMTSEASGIHSTSLYQSQTQHQHLHRKPTRPDGEPIEGGTHQHHHKHSKRIVLVKNSDPSTQKTIVLHRRNVRSLGAVLDDVSELMQCLIRKLYTLEGHKIDSIQSLLQCPSILVCVGREPFHPLLLNSFRKNSDEKLPKLVLKSRSSAYNEEQGCKNVKFGLETKKSIIHPRSYSNDKSPRFSMSSEKPLPHGLTSIPPLNIGSYPQARDSMMDDDIKKRVLVNKDGSLSMEMKVRFRLVNDETLHWSTEIKKSSGISNESFTGSNDAYYLQHGNSESCSEAESLAAGDVVYTKLHQKHMEEPHCQHCCIHCQEYDIWKNPAFGEQEPVRHCRSSSSSESSHKIVHKKSSIESMHTMSSEEYTEQVVEKATCIQHTVGEEGDTTVEYCTISRCCSRSEVCSVSAKKANTEEKYGKGENNQVFINDEQKPESALLTVPFEDVENVSVQITQAAQEEHRPVSVESNSSQVLASLKEDQDEEETDFPPNTSRASQSNNQEDDAESKNVASSLHYVTSCKSPMSPKHQLSPKPPCNVSGCLVKSRSRQYQKPKNVMPVEKEAFECNVSEGRNQPDENVLNETDTQDEEQANVERAISSTSTKSKPDNDVGEETAIPAETKVKERSSSAMSNKSNASGKSGKSNVNIVVEKEYSNVKDNSEERTTSAMSSNSNISARSKQSKLYEVADKEKKEVELQIEERVKSAMSNTSTRSSQSRDLEVAADEFVEAKYLLENRTPSAMSTESARSNSSRISEYNDLKEGDCQIEGRSPSTMSIKSNTSEVTSVKPQNMESHERVPSNMSTKSNVSATSKKSKISHGTAANTVKTGDRELEDRVPSAMSAKSNTSVRSNTSNALEAVPVMTCKDSDEHSERKVERTMSHTVGSTTPDIFSEVDSQNNEVGLETLEERAPSARSIKSNASARSNKSEVSSVAPEEANELEDDLGKRASSAMSSRSATSSRSEKYKKCKGIEEKTEKLQDRTPSVMSHTSERSKKCNTSEVVAGELGDIENKLEQRAPSAMSTKSNTSTKTNKSRISEYVADIADEEATERSKSVMSSISNVSTKSKKSKMSLLTNEERVGLQNQTEKRPSSALSVKSCTSESSAKSKISEITNKQCKDAEKRSPSAMTSKSNVSERSERSKVSELAQDDTEDTEQRAPSALSSPKSNISGRSEKSHISIVDTDDTVVLEQKDSSAKSEKSNHPTSNEQNVERVASALSTKTEVSVKSNKSKASDLASEEPEHVDEDKRPSSCLSCPMSNVSMRSNSSNVSTGEPKEAEYHTEERDPSNISAQSIETHSETTVTKSGKTKTCEKVGLSSSKLSAKSRICKKSERSNIAEAQTDSPAEVNKHPEERAASVLSAKSNVSVKSKKSTVSEAQSENIDVETCQTGERSQSALSIRTNASERSVTSKASETPGDELDEDEKERALSAMCCKSIVSSASNKSKNSGIVIHEPEERDNDIEQRPQSTTSAKSYVSSRSKISEETPEEIETVDEEGKEDMVASAMSPCSLSEKSNASATTKNFKFADTEPEDTENEDEENSKRASSATSLKSTVSTKSKKSESSGMVPNESADIDQTAMRTPSVLSAKSNTSTKSKKSTNSEKGCKAKEEVKYERPQSAVSAKSNSSVMSKGSEVGLEEKAPSIGSTKSRTSTKREKSNTPTKTVITEHIDPAEPKETTEKQTTEERALSPLSVKSNVSSRSAKQKSLTLTIGQATESQDQNERSATALSTGSVKSIHSEDSHRQGKKEWNSSTLSNQSNTPAIITNISEAELHIQRSSPVSAKSNSSEQSRKPKALKTQAEGDIQMEELNRTTSELSAKSSISTKSKKSNAEEEQEIGSNSKASSSVKCVCGGSKKSKQPETQYVKKADNEERSASALSKKSAKSKSSSVSSTSEMDLTPASASVSIGIVEEYDADNTEEEHSVSVASASSVPPMKSKSDCSSTANRQGMETSDNDLKLDERCKSSQSAGTNVSKKSKKSNCLHSSLPTKPISDNVCGTEDDAASNTSVTQNTLENKSESHINTKQKYSIKEGQSSSKVSIVSQSKESKPSSDANRPRSNFSNTSSHLEVKKQKSNSNSSNRPTKEDEELPTRPRSTDQYITSENRLSPRPSKSPKRSKKPVIVLGGSNDSVLSQSVSASEPLNDNNLNTGGDVSDQTNASDRTCNGPLDVTDDGRDVSDKTSEKSSKCRNRKGSNTSQHKVDEISELVPSNLPNASPTEVVSDWLNKIPLDSALYELGDELETLNRLGEPTQNEKENESEGGVDMAVTESEIEKEAQLATEELHNNDKEECVKQETNEDLEKIQSGPENDASKSFNSSVQVMRVLLNPKLDRCSSLPEVSTVYRRKLSTSATGLLDCLVNLELIDFDPNDMNGKAEKYKDLMNMLKSLWLCDPYDRMTATQKSKSTDQHSLDDELKAKSSSGVDVSSGSTGSGKSSVIDSTRAQKSQTNTDGEGPETLTKVQEVDETEREEVFEVIETNPATPDIASRVQWTPETKAERTEEERIKDSNIPASDDTIRSNDSPREPFETPTSSTKSTGNECQDDTSSGTPPSIQRAPLTKRFSQDPDPVWVLTLLNKIQKQFMTHYVNAMTEFKVRWNLDGNEQLDGMISELRNEVHKRIQSSINRELKKIQGRAGRPKPPKEAMSRESTIQTEQRRRRLKVMLNQSIDPAAKSDDDYTATGTDFSDQRSDDEYCPCDTCMKKKMASKPALPAEVLNCAPAMMDFDLRKILQLKKDAPTNNKENIVEVTGNEELNTEGKGLAEDLVIPDYAETYEPVDTKTEKQEADDCEKEIDSCTVEAETTYELKTHKLELVSDVGIYNVEAAKTDTEADKKIAEGGPASEETVEANETGVAEDVEKGSEEGEIEGEEQPPEAELAEENEITTAEEEDKYSDRESVKEVGKVETGEDETSEPENTESETTTESETPEEQITDKYQDTETLEKNETPVGDEGEPAAEFETVETTNAAATADDEHEAPDKKEFLSEGTGEEEDTLEPEKGDSTHYGEIDGDESVEEKDNAIENTTAEDKVEDGVVEEDKNSKTADGGDTADDEPAVEFSKIKEENTVDDKAETAEEEETADETTEDRDTDNCETVENEETADETQEDGEAANGAVAEVKSAEDGSASRSETTVDHETDDDETAQDGETSKADTAEDRESAGETGEDKKTDIETGEEDKTTEDGEITNDGIADKEISNNAETDNEETEEAETAENIETAVEYEETAGEMSAEEREEPEIAEERETGDNTTDNGEIAQEAAEDEEMVGDEMAKDSRTEAGIRNYVETADDGIVEDEERPDAATEDDEDADDDGTAEDREAPDGATTEDEGTSGDTTAEDGEIADDGTAEDGEMADDGTADDGETADDGTADDGETADEATAEDGVAADDGTAEDGVAADDGTAEDGETADDRTAEDGETADDGTAEDGETADDGTAEDGVAADDVTAEDEETADDGTADDGETADDGTAEDGKTADDASEEDGVAADDGTAEARGTAGDKTAEHGETVDTESLENEVKADEEEGTDNGETDENDTADGEEGGVKEAGIADEEKQDQTDGPDVNSSMENTDGHDEVTELKADDEAEDEDVLLKNEGDVVVHSIDENTSIEESKEEHSDYTKAEESSELTSDNQDKGHSGTSEKDDMREYLNGHLVNNGESAEGGDEAEDETEPDVDTDEEGKEVKSSAVQSMQYDDQNTETTMASFNAIVKLSTGSEDGADADVEDSETEVHDNDDAENEYEDDSVTTDKKQAIPHSLANLAKLSDIAEDAAEDEKSEETSKQDVLIKNTDCEEVSDDGGLPRQITKSSIESQPGSLEEVVDEKTESIRSSAQLTAKGNYMCPTITSKEDSKETQEKSDKQSADLSRQAATPKKSAKKSNKQK